MSQTTDGPDLPRNESNGRPTERRIKAMDAKTAKTISSGQVITSLSNVVKELLENAMDAKATVITVRLREWGKEAIEVTDNGFGIDAQDFHSLAKRHFTSKLNDFEELQTITSFGFRGEALNSLCALADLSIQTRYLRQTIGTHLRFDSDANIISREAMARNIGTTVSVQNLFHNIPVRKKEFHSNIKREFDRMVRLVYGYCIGTVGLRLTLTNQTTNKAKQTIVSTPGLSLKNNIIEVFDTKQLNSLTEFRQFVGSVEDPNVDRSIRMTGFISKCDSGCGRSATDRQFFYVNGRPSEMKNVSKFINDVYHNFNRNQLPFVLLNLEIDRSCVDFNLSPDKRQLLIANEEQILAIIKESLTRMYNKESSCSLDSMSNYTTKVSVLSQQMKKRRPESPDEEVSAILASPLKMSRCRSPCDSPFREIADKESPTIRPTITPPIRPNVESSASKERRERPKSFTTALNVMNAALVKRPEFGENVNFVANERHSVGANDSPDNTVLKTNEEIPVTERDVPMVSTEKRRLSADGVDIESTTTGSDSTNHKKQCLTEFQISVDSDEEQTDDNKSKSDSTELIVDIDLETIRAQFQRSIAPKVSANAHKFSARITSSQNETAEQELIHELNKTSFEEMKIVGQFNKGFIVAKLWPHLFVIDQHASDERFNYERFLDNTVVENQNLVVPMPLELSSANEMVVIDNLNAFKKLGFGLVVNETAPSGQRLLLSSLPISKDWTAGKEDIEEIVGKIIETRIELLKGIKLQSFQKAMASRACRASVMIGEALSRSQMKSIVDHMSHLKNPWHCAHNRPTIRHLVCLDDISSLSNN